MKQKYVLSAAVCLALGGCAQNAPQLHDYSNLTYEAGFDTVYAYSETGYDQELMQKHYETGTDLFSYYNSLFDIYQNYEGIDGLKAVNDNAGIAPVKVDAEIIDMLKEAKYFYDLTDGKFDVTMGALMQVWHTYRENGMKDNEAGTPAPAPSEEELQEAYACRGWDKVIIDEENSTVFLTDSCMSLDAGGIAKGYAAEKIAQAIDSGEIISATINAGRNIRTIHVKPDDSPWRIAIQDPGGEGSIIIVEAEDSVSFVTSGDYERYYTGEDGIVYHHIIDPDTMKPSVLYHSVSVITKDSGAADCLSTALFNLSVEDGKKAIAQYKKDSGEECEAVWMMDPDKTQNESGRTVNGLFIVYTENLEDRILWP